MEPSYCFNFLKSSHACLIFYYKADVLFNSKIFKKVNKSIVFCSYTKEALPGKGWGVNYVTHLNFKTSHVGTGIYKCLSLIVGFAVTVAIWPRDVVSCLDFILRTVATFWATLLVGIYPGRASLISVIG